MVVDEFGRECTDHVDIGNVFHNYFMDLFSNSSLTTIDEILREVTCHLTSSDVTTLSKSFSKKKVKATIDEMTPDKAPRPDDVIVGFFQKN